MDGVLRMKWLAMQAEATQTAAVGLDEWTKYCEDTTATKKRATRTVWAGKVPIGSEHRIARQTMTTTNTNDVEATVAQARRPACFLHSALPCSPTASSIPPGDGAVGRRSLRLPSPTRFSHVAYRVTYHVTYCAFGPQVMKCADAGADLVRITVQGKREAAACKKIREMLDQKVE